MIKETLIQKYDNYKLRNINYYKNVFRKLNQENKTTFNWASCFLGTSWMIYRRMWFTAIVYLIITDTLSYIANVFLNSKPASLIISIISLLVLGRYGNSLYLTELKWKIKQGYHLNENFSPTSIRSVMYIAIIYAILIGIVAASFAISHPKENINNYPFYMLTLQLINPLIFAAAIYYEFNTYKNIKEENEVQDKDINQYLESKGNDMSVIGLTLYIFIIFILPFICAVIAVISMKVVGDDFTSHLNSIAEQINQEDKKTYASLKDQILDTSYHSSQYDAISKANKEQSYQDIILDTISYDTTSKDNNKQSYQDIVLDTITTKPLYNHL